MHILLGVLGTQEILLIIFIVAGILLIPKIFFFITQQNLLKSIQPQNRTMPPGQVWLQFIPLFNFVWHFIVVGRIADSIQNELASENSFSFENASESYQSYNEKRPTYNIGIAYSVLSILAMIPGIGGLFGLAGIVCWIIYWVKLSEYKTKIEIKRNSETDLAA